MVTVYRLNLTVYLIRMGPLIKTAITIHVRYPENKQ